MKRYWKNMKEEYSFYKSMCDYEAWENETPKLSKIRLIADFSWGMVKNVLHRLVCRLRGHKWRTYGWCTPDTGGESITCDRCGESHTHSWY